MSANNKEEKQRIADLMSDTGYHNHINVVVLLSQSDLIESRKHKGKIDTELSKLSGIVRKRNCDLTTITMTDEEMMKISAKEINTCKCNDDFEDYSGKFNFTKFNFCFNGIIIINTESTDSKSTDNKINIDATQYKLPILKIDITPENTQYEEIYECHFTNKDLTTWLNAIIASKNSKCKIVPRGISTLTQLPFTDEEQQIIDIECKKSHDKLMKNFGIVVIAGDGYNSRDYNGMTRRMEEARLRHKKRKSNICDQIKGMMNEFEIFPSKFVEMNAKTFETSEFPEKYESKIINYWNRQPVYAENPTVIKFAIVIHNLVEGDDKILNDLKTGLNSETETPYSHINLPILVIDAKIPIPFSDFKLWITKHHQEAYAEKAADCAEDGVDFY